MIRVVNLAKHEYLDPECGCGDGQYAREADHTLRCLQLLLTVGDGRTTGDLRLTPTRFAHLSGRWVGDPVAFVGEGVNAAQRDGTWAGAYHAPTGHAANVGIVRHDDDASVWRNIGFDCMEALLTVDAGFRALVLSRADFRDQWRYMHPTRARRKRFPWARLLKGGHPLPSPGVRRERFRDGSAPVAAVVREHRLSDRAFKAWATRRGVQPDVRDGRDVVNVSSPVRHGAARAGTARSIVAPRKIRFR